VRALHVGNFVGVSLCHLSWLARERHPDSTVVSIDPNIAHREIEDPQAHVVALLHHFGLLANNLIIPGYTLEQTAGEATTGNIEADHLAGLACENVLAALEHLCGPRFDLVLLDGNHEQSYLAREFAALGGLLPTAVSSSSTTSPTGTGSSRSSRRRSKTTASWRSGGTDASGSCRKRAPELRPKSA